MREAAQAGSLLCFYSLPQDRLSWSDQRHSFWHETLLAFHEELQRLGQELHLTTKAPSRFLGELAQIHPLSKVIYTRGFSSGQEALEGEVKSFCQDKGIKVSAVDQLTLLDEEDLPFELSALPKTFTSFRKKVEKNLQICPLGEEVLSLPPPPKREGTLMKELLCSFDQLERKLPHPLFSGGEKKGLERLDFYFWQSDRVATYKETRNGMIDFDDSSKFSPWLALGAISPKKIYWELKDYEASRVENESTYWVFFELLWRDYFKFLWRSAGDGFLQMKKATQEGAEKLGEKFDEKLDEAAQESVLRAWTLGETESDFVNANMKELLHTGWMSNRGRQNVASYLAKQLRGDWKLGAKWFEKQLLDYDEESNWGNWAYLAGVGVDPRDRSFNVERQAEMYDPEGLYRQKWTK